MTAIFWYHLCLCDWRLQQTLTNSVTDIINQRLVQMSDSLAFFHAYFRSSDCESIANARRMYSNKICASYIRIWTGAHVQDCDKLAYAAFRRRCVVCLVVRFLFFHFFHRFCISFFKLNLLPAIHKSAKLFSPQTVWVAGWLQKAVRRAYCGADAQLICTSW